MQFCACPVCKSDKQEFLFDRLDHTHYVTSDRFRIVRCKRCSMVFVNPRPDPLAIKTFYTPDFYDVKVGAEDLLEAKQSSLNAKAEMLADLSPGRLLDVGCQKGEFLFWMKQRGWDVHGVEFSETPPNLFDMPIHYGPIQTAALEPHSFDAITLWAVLEHVHEPIEMLGEVRKLLAPNGRVFVLVPNFRSPPGRVMRHDDVPRHLLMFTPSTLSRAARLAGLHARRVVFGDDIFSGSNRGLLTFLVKRALGESYDDILRQNRSSERWAEFTASVNGKPSDLVRTVDRIDLRLFPYIDRLMRRLRCSFIMTAELEML